MKVIGLRYPEEIPDAELAGRVMRALSRNGLVKSDDLQIFVEDGEVTLLGTVDTPYERHQAGRLAGWTHGVRRLHNRIAVAIDQPLSDRDLQQRVQSALASHPLFARYPVTATVTRGVVTLRGQVDTLAQKRIMVAVAENVKGVRQVVSALQIGQIAPADQPVPIVDDALLLSEVNAAIGDASVTIFENETYVRDGIVHLRGLVPSRRAVIKAIEAAQRVPHLQGIRNELVLQADPASRDLDEALIGRVVEAFRRDGRVSPTQVTPSAAGGIVVLSGQVDSIEDHDAALEIAASVPGVFKVIDDIRLLGRAPLWASDRRKGIR